MFHEAYIYKKKKNRGSNSINLRINTFTLVPFYTVAPLFNYMDEERGQRCLMVPPLLSPPFFPKSGVA